MDRNFAAKLIDEIGHDVLCSQLGFTERNLRHVRSTGQFAAQWYPPVKELAEVRGVDCPLSAFSFKSLPQNVGTKVNDCKGAA